MVSEIELILFYRFHSSRVVKSRVLNLGITLLQTAFNTCVLYFNKNNKAKSFLLTVTFDIKIIKNN